MSRRTFESYAADENIIFVPIPEDNFASINASGEWSNRRVPGNVNPCRCSDGFDIQGSFCGLRIGYSRSDSSPCSASPSVASDRLNLDLVRRSFDRLHLIVSIATYGAFGLLRCTFKSRPYLVAICSKDCIPCCGNSPRAGDDLGIRGSREVAWRL